MKSKKFLIRMLSVIMALLIAAEFFPAMGVKAADADISERAVDSITITKTNGEELDNGSISAWNDFKVKVDFSEDDENGNQKSNFDIRSGDTISISWAAPKGVSWIGYSKSIELKQDSTVLGTAKITGSDALITFNDNVTKLQHVSGSVEFSIQNHNNPSTDVHAGTITAGDNTVSVTVNPVETLKTFGSKGGAYETDGSNIIRWTIWINNNAQADLTGNITIEDTLPSTEEFYENVQDLKHLFSYALYKDGTVNYIAYSTDQFKNAGCGIEFEGQKIKITIPVTKENSGSIGQISFCTKSTAAAGSTVANEITMTHYVTSNPNEPITEDYIGRTTVPNSDGNISGVPKGTIRIHKVVNGTTDPIPNITFRIYKVYSESDHTRINEWYQDADYAEIKTDDKGYAEIQNLSDGYYELAEQSNENNSWIAESSIKSVIVSLGGDVGTEKEIGNTVKTTDVTATKEWKDANGNADTGSHPITYFKLYRTPAGGTLEEAGQEIKTVTTAAGDSSATVKWENLPQYDNSGNEYAYSVKEVDEDGNDSTPEGYYKTESGLKVINQRTSNRNITATKKWVLLDGTTPDTGEHPVTWLKLYRSINGEEGSLQAVPDQEVKRISTAAGDTSTTVTWENLPQHNSSGKAYIYSVKEVDENGNDFTPVGYEKTENGTTVINRKVVKDISAEKLWKNSDDSEDTGYHPTVYLQLYRQVNGGTPEKVDDRVEINTPAGESSTKVSWEDKPIQDGSGNEYTYFIKEVNKDGTDLDFSPSGYSKTESGLTVTNKKENNDTPTPPVNPKQKKTDITATKNWYMSDGITLDTGEHPTIYFTLYRSTEEGVEEAVSTKAVETETGKCSASVTWKDMLAEDSDGKAYTYTVKETDAEGNDAVPDGWVKSENGLSVKNMRKPSVSNEQPSDNVTPADNTNNNQLTTPDNGRNRLHPPFTSNWYKIHGKWYFVHTYDEYERLMNSVDSGVHDNSAVWIGMLGIAALGLAISAMLKKRKLD